MSDPSCVLYIPPTPSITTLFSVYKNIVTTTERSTSRSGKTL